MRKVGIVMFILCFVVLAVTMIWGDSFGLDVRWMDVVKSALMVGCFLSFVVVVIYRKNGGLTDGDLIAGVEDEDGLVFALTTPVEELVQKDIVIFNVVKKRG